MEFVHNNEQKKKSQANDDYCEIILFCEECDARLYQKSAEQK